MGPDDRQRETIDDLDVLLASLPPEIVKAVHRLPNKEELIEVVRDLGRKPEGRDFRSSVWRGRGSSRCLGGRRCGSPFAS